MKKNKNFTFIVFLGIIVISFSFLLGNIIGKFTTNVHSNNDRNVTYSQKNQLNKVSLDNFLKTYLYSFVKNDWENVLKMTDGEYKKILKEKLIPNYKNNPKITKKFNTNSFNYKILSFSEEQIVLEVNYIVDVSDEKITIPQQFKNIVTLIKKDNKFFVVDIK